MKLFLLSKLFLPFVLFFFGQVALAQNVPIKFEAEQGSYGADFVEGEDGAIVFVTCSSDGAGDAPGNSDRIVSYSVDFSEAGVYDLYARLRIGPAGASDDSFFYGNGFGEKNTSDGKQWITINNIQTGGYAAADQVVSGEGDLGGSVWKWINLSECSKQETPVTFSITEENLKVVLQIGAREDGLDFDQFAFAKANLFYTVKNLENGESGSSEIEEPEVMLPIAEGKSKFLGNVYSNSQRIGFTTYWNQVTPENAGKWGSVERTRDVMNWSELDAAYKLAKDNNYPFKIHVLVWGNQQPSWIENLSVTEQYEEIEEWFRAVADRYPEIEMIEVVNEPLHDPPIGAGNGNYMNALGGTGQSGHDWILEAFRMAREIFPQSELMINEYNVINNAGNMSKYIAIVNSLKAEGLIDCVGFQAHAFSTRGAASQMLSNLNNLAKVELPLYITELDIDGETDQIQLKDYQRIFPVFWEHQWVRGVTLWGFRPGMWRSTEKAYLIDTDGSERPALKWLREYVSGTEFVGVDEVAGFSDLVVYPNPVVDKMITIEGVEHFRSIELFNLNGKIVQSEITNGQDLVQLNLDISPGLYIIQLKNEQQTYRNKIVVK